MKTITEKDVGKNAFLISLDGRRRGPRFSIGLLHKVRNGTAVVVCEEGRSRHYTTLPTYLLEVE